MTKEKVGFIGLGSQGGPMAHRIMDAGYPLVVWARRDASVSPYRDKGATVVSTITELGMLCDHVGICVVNDADVLSICDQLIPALNPGSRLAVHSTIYPDTCKAIELRCEKDGVLLIDAPVSGGAPGAAAGTLTVMCGATQEAFLATKTVFETFGKLILLLGPVGSGQRAKLVNNAMLSANLGVAHAGMAAGDALGLDRQALISLIKESSGRSAGFETYARLPSPAAFTTGGPLLLKDMNLLMAALSGHEGAQTLAAAADHFLAAANPDC